MTLRTKMLMSAVSLLFLVIAAGTVYLIIHKILSMEFRAANDVLHTSEPHAFTSTSGTTSFSKRIEPYDGKLVFIPEPKLD